MLKPDRFSCSQKIWLKWDPPVHRSIYIIKQAKSESKFENLFFFKLGMSIDLKSLDKIKKVSSNFFIW